MSLRERGRIGIIEDNTTMGDSLVQRLELEGYTPLWWQTGQKALEELFAARPDLVVCDIVLPDISGEEVFLKALPRLGSTPFLFVTAHGKIDQAVRLTKAGAVDYLEKPYEITDLLDQLAEAGPLLAELSGVMRSFELLAVAPLYVIHHVAAVLATVQAHRYEAGLRGHEAGALGHEASAPVAASVGAF